MTKIHSAAPELELHATIDRPLVYAKGGSVRFLVVEVVAPVAPTVESGAALG